jgi:dihydrofolate synthase/folylpolyglutamate synthase
MTRTAGHGPQRDERRTAQISAEAERLSEVRRAILARAPEHDLVPDLNRIAAVCELMGDPQKAFRVVHVTGTNGKTSTSRIVERLLREHGLRTGRFVSPHLTDLRERIAIDGDLLTPQRFVEVYEEVAPYVEIVDARSTQDGQPRMTFFEVLVAMAYAAFADAPVDAAVIEVGMGGRWDATNVADGEVAVVTPIAIDHQRFLGRELSSIAGEKSRIVKPGATAVIAQQPIEAAEVLLRHAAQVGATLAREGLEFGVVQREVAVGGQQITLQGLTALYPDLFLPLHGIHQARNAACALAAVEAFLGAGPGGLDPDVVRAGFAGVDSPGRLEVVRRSPTVLVDAAHNPAGAQALAEALDEAFAFTRLVGVVGVLADKDAEGILAALEPVLDHVVVTEPRSRRATPIEELGELAVDIFGEDRVDVAGRLDDALDLAVALAEAEGTPGAGVVATGSITVAGEVRTLFGRA